MTQSPLTSVASALKTLGQVVTLVGVSLYAAGCEDAPPATNERGFSAGPAPAAAAPAAAAGQTKLALRDDDFVESDRNRDPFRSFSLTPGVRGDEAIPMDPQRPVVMPDTAVEEMRLIAVVLGLSRPKAMLTAPDGVGYVVQRGDYLGKPKVLTATGSVPMTLNWRVDRIREHEIVLTRQDPTDGSHTPMSRVITMVD